MTKNALELLVEMYPKKQWWKGGMFENPLITMDLVEKMEKNEINWEKLSKNSGITMKMICDNIEKSWDFGYVSNNPNLTIEMIKKFPYKKWNWEHISCNSAMTSDIIESNLDLPWNWDSMGSNPSLTPEFIEKHFREFTEQGSAHTRYIFCKTVGLDMVDKNHTLNWNWRGISDNSGLTIDFIRKYRNYVNEKNLYFTTDRMGFYSNRDSTDKLCWDIVSANPNFTYEMMQKNCDIPWDYNGISRNPNLKIDDVKNNMSYRWNWSTISGNKGISEEDIENNPNLPWDFSWITYNPNISIEFLEKHLDKIDRWYLSKCPKLTFDFIKNHTDALDFSSLSKNPLTLENYLLKEKSRVKSSEEILVLNIVKPYQDKIDELTRENKRLNSLFAQFKNLINPIQTNKIEYSIPKKKYTPSILESSFRKGEIGIVTKRRDGIDSTFRRFIPFEFSLQRKL